MADKHQPTAADAHQLLTVELDWPDASNISKIGAGAWSTAFGFTNGHGQEPDDHAPECCGAAGSDYVLRIGAHLDDFRNDEAMAQYRSPQLPVPTVHEVGDVPNVSGLFYCISTRAQGSPLELCGDAWPALVGSLADALEAMRSVVPPPGHPPTSWHEQLLSVERGLLDDRLSGWRNKLAASDTASKAFSAALRRWNPSNSATFHRP